MADERDVLICPMKPIVEAGERTKKRLEAALNRLVDRRREPNYDCYICLDTGYTSREVVDAFGQLCAVSRPCQGTAETPCRKGLPIEAGLWARAMKPHRGQSEPAQELLRKFMECLRRHPHGNELRARVEYINANG